ncbi:hypothetical protein COLO4_33270 [Corchorus olitorius]|uniref:Tetratricopeptide-like helical n=1 Tax=Corchorus olitorius TaxID=93759 RepID=A0A1R3GVG8_9ROSI|nr:hypothetical protein COLO4_33270 [Corchorus olitorius]
MEWSAECYQRALHIDARDYKSWYGLGSWDDISPFSSKRNSDLLSTIFARLIR